MNYEIQSLKQEIEMLKTQNSCMYEALTYIAHSIRSHTLFINGCEEMNRRDHLIDVGKHISEILDETFLRN